MKALWLNFISAIMAVIGVFVTLFVGGTIEGVTSWLIPVAAGGFIYIAMSDLIPELHKTKQLQHSALQLVAVVFGIIAMILLLALE